MQQEEEVSWRAHLHDGKVGYHWGALFLARARTRTKLEAMLWLVGLYPVWVLAAAQGFNFLISSLARGDVMAKQFGNSGSNAADCMSTDGLFPFSDVSIC